MTPAAHVAPQAPTVAVDRPPAPAPTELADELLAELGRLGARTAELGLTDRAAWDAVRPALARLSSDGRRLVGDLAVARGAVVDLARPLQAADPPPPVVWAREVAAVHRLVRRALAAPTATDPRDDHRAAALQRTLHTARAATRAVATAQRPSHDEALLASTLALEDTQVAHGGAT